VHGLHGLLHRACTMHASSTCWMQVIWAIRACHMHGGSTMLEKLKLSGYTSIVEQGACMLRDPRSPGVLPLLVHACTPVDAATSSMHAVLTFRLCHVGRDCMCHSCAPCKRAQLH
jgi:hypothetical protein